MPSKFPKRSYEPRPRKTAQRDEREDRPERQSRGGDRRPRPAATTAWEQQATWYDQLHGDQGDDFHSKLILPSVLRQLDAAPGQRLLDLCCGQGVLGRAAAAAGLYVTGIDASPSLVEIATKRAGKCERYQVGDARKLGALLQGEIFDHAALVLALQDLDPIGPVFANIFRLLRPGGRLVIVLTHPCFRIPKRTSWVFDENTGVQYRRIEGYLTPLSMPIKTHPGRPEDSKMTTSFHRPLHHYLGTLGNNGFGVIGCEELCSHRRGTQGVRSGAEDRAAREFPVFLVLTAIRLDKIPRTRRTKKPAAEG